MPRWTGPARIVLRGDSPQARFRAAQLRSRARTLAGQIANEIELGGIWFGTRLFQIDDQARIFITVNQSFDDGPVEVEAVIEVTSRERAERPGQVIPAGISYGPIGNNGPKLLLSLPDKQLRAVGVYSLDDPLENDFTYPPEQSMLELEDQDFSNQPPYNNIFDVYRSEYGYDWEDLSGQIHLVADFSSTNAQRLASSYFENTSVPPDPERIWKDGYAWSLLPPTDPGVTQYLRGFGVFDGTLHVIMEERTDDYGIILRAYTRAYSPTPYATNTINDGNDEFTWTLAHSYEMPESSLPVCETLGVTNDISGVRVSTAPGFFFANSGFEAVAVFKRSGYFYIELQYIVGAGFLVMGGGWKFNYIPYSTGNSGPTGAILNGAAGAEFSASRSATSTVSSTNPGAVDPCDDGDYTETFTLINDRSWSAAIDDQNIEEDDLQAPFAELEVENAAFSMENVLGIDYLFGTNVIQRLKLDITGSSIRYSNNHDYYFSRVAQVDNVCSGGDHVQDVAGTGVGTFTADSTFEATGAVLKINDTVICALEEVDHDWQFEWDGTHSWACSSRPPGALGTIYNYSAASGSVSTTGSFTQNYKGISSFAFADLRFGQLGLHQFEATSSFTISGGGSPSVVPTATQAGVNEILMSFDIRLNSTGSAERDKALYYNGFQLNTVLDLPRNGAGQTGKVYDAVDNEQIALFQNSLVSGTANSFSLGYAYLPTLQQMKLLFGNGPARGYWSPFEDGTINDPDWPLYRLVFFYGGEDVPAASESRLNYTIPGDGLFPKDLSSPIEIGADALNDPCGYSAQRGGNYVCNFNFARPLLTSKAYFMVNGSELPFLGVDYDDTAAGSSFGQIFSF